MTSEIVVINSQAVALAADSAVTISQNKIYNSANKLFALSKYRPVGIMIYGNANFADVPWETIIKLYRKKLSTKKFDKLENYASDFLKYIEKNAFGINEDKQKNHLAGLTFTIFTTIKNQIVEQMRGALKVKSEISNSEIDEITTAKIDDVLKGIVKPKKKISSIYKVSFSTRYSKVIDEVIKNVFQNHPLSKENIENLHKIIENTFTSDNFPFPNLTSGIVVAGFGEKELFPATIAYEIHSFVNNKLHFKEVAKKGGDQAFAAIFPFAQAEMVHTFMTGIDPNFQSMQNSYLENIFTNFPALLLKDVAVNQKIDDTFRTSFEEILKKNSATIYDEYRKTMESFSKQKHIDPVATVVSILPKDELAQMAEALVNLTSFKRRISTSQETVGGPIDVAVISKGDGFIWIKRKHYFKPEMNHHFFKSYFREEDN